MADTIGMCGWQIGDYGDQKPCQQPADRTIVVGCVREHISKPLMTCPTCASAFAREQALGNMLCTPCSKHGAESPLAVLSVDML